MKNYFLLILTFISISLVFAQKDLGGEEEYRVYNPDYLPNNAVTEEMLIYYDEFLSELLTVFETDEELLPEISEMKDECYREYITKNIGVVTREINRVTYGYVDGLIAVTGTASVSLITTLKDGEKFPSFHYDANADIEIIYIDYSLERNFIGNGNLTVSIKKDISRNSYQRYKINGIIDFNGKFAGSIVFDNIEIDLGSKSCESYKCEPYIKSSSGDLYIISNGKKIKFPRSFSDYPDIPVKEAISLLPIRSLSEEFNQGDF